MLLWEALLELLYPSKCVLCGKLLDGNETNLCGSCRRALQPFTGKATKPALTSSVTVAYAYEDPLRQSLLRYKFQGRSYYAGAYGAMLGMQILREHLEFDVITWVPVSRKRRRKRGYDQAELLAKATARELGPLRGAAFGEIPRYPAPIRHSGWPPGEKQTCWVSTGCGRALRCRGSGFY